MGRSLAVQEGDFKARHLSVVIYWKKRTGIDSLQNGHAALIIDSSEFRVERDDYYVSWLSQGGGKTGLVGRATQASFLDDCAQWGGNEVGQYGYHVPSRWVMIDGLNTGDMKAAWDQMRTKERAHWKLFDKNCATAVARILKAGGGDGFARAHKHQMVWWPTDLLKYARSMGQHVYKTS